MNVGELFLKLGFKVDDGPLRGFDSQVTNVRNNLFGVKEYALAAGYAVGQFIQNTVQGTADMKSFNDQTGLSLELLQDYQNVGVSLNRNLSRESILNSIKNLQNLITSIQRFGQGDRMGFTAFGVDVMTTDAYQTLDRIRETISQYDRPTAVNLLGRLGLDPNFISLLEMTNEEFAQLSNNLRLTADQSDNVDRLGKEIDRTVLQFQHWKDVMTAEWAPAMISGMAYIKELGITISQTFALIKNALADAPIWATGPLAALAAGLAAAARPALILYGALAAIPLAMNEIRKAIIGEDNIFDAANQWMFDNVGTKWAEGLFNPDSDNNIIRRLNRAAEGAAQKNGTTNNSKVQNLNNTFNIQSTADPMGVSEAVMNSFENTLDQLNNGPVN